MPRPDSPPTASKLERHCGRTIGTLDVSHASVDAIDFLQPRLERQPQHLCTGQHPLCRGFADANHTRQHRHSATAPVRQCGCAGRGLLSALAAGVRAVARPGEEPWDGDGGTCAPCTIGSAADATHGLRRSSPTVRRDRRVLYAAACAPPPTNPAGAPQGLGYSAAGEGPELTTCPACDRRA